MPAGSCSTSSARTTWGWPRQAMPPARRTRQRYSQTRPGWAAWTSPRCWEACRRLYGNLHFAPNASTTTTGSDGGNAVNWLPGGSLFVVEKINQDWSVGFGVLSYFGLSTTYDDNWVGRYYVQKGDTDRAHAHAGRQLPGQREALPRRGPQHHVRVSRYPDSRQQYRRGAARRPAQAERQPLGLRCKPRHPRGALAGDALRADLSLGGQARFQCTAPVQRPGARAGNGAEKQGLAVQATST